MLIIKVETSKNINDFYVFIEVKEGDALMHVYVWEHIVMPLVQDRWMIAKRRYKELMAPHMC